MRILGKLTQNEQNYCTGFSTSKVVQVTIHQEGMDVPTDDQKANMRDGDSDSVKISSVAYRLQSDDNKLRATSGKDTLNVTKGAQADSFVVHFEDSAAVSRTVERGYIKINGIKVGLTDNVKKQLLETDKQAEAAREKTFMHYTLQYDAAVAKQQADVWKSVGEEQSRAMSTATKISRGKKVTLEDEKQLMQTNPGLYAIVKAAAMLAKHQKKDVAEDTSTDVSEKKDEGRQTSEAVPGGSSDRPQHETQMTISLSSGQPQIQSINEGIAGAET
jgi:hypothetical protein